MNELTPTEVVALFGLDERRVRKDVEYGVFDRLKGPPRFALAEVVYLFAVGGLALELGVDDRKKLYRLIAAALDERKLPERVAEIQSEYAIRRARMRKAIPINPLRPLKACAPLLRRLTRANG